jgi:hypothetical protein
MRDELRMRFANVTPTLNTHTTILFFIEIIIIIVVVIVNVIFFLHAGKIFIFRLSVWYKSSMSCDSSLQKVIQQVTVNIVGRRTQL